MSFFDGTQTALVASTRPSLSSVWTSDERSIAPTGAPPSATCVASRTRILLRVKRRTYAFVHDGETAATGSEYASPPSTRSSPATFQDESGTHGCCGSIR